MPRKSTTAKAPKASAPAPAPEAKPVDDEQLTTLVGRLCADPVLRHTKSGLPVTTLRLAVQGTDPTTFIDAVVWRRQAEVSAQYLRKGRLVEVEGRNQSRTWEDQDGNKRTTDEVVARRVQFLSSQSASQREAGDVRAVA